MVFSSRMPSVMTLTVEVAGPPSTVASENCSGMSTGRENTLRGLHIATSYMQIVAVRIHAASRGLCICSIHMELMSNVSQLQVALRDQLRIPRPYLEMSAKDGSELQDTMVLSALLEKVIILKLVHPGNPHECTSKLRGLFRMGYDFDSDSDSDSVDSDSDSASDSDSGRVVGSPLLSLNFDSNFDDAEYAMLVRYLLEYGADPNTMERSASWSQGLKFVGASIPDAVGPSELHMPVLVKAACLGKTSICSLLLQDSRLSREGMMDNNDHTALHWAAFYGHVDVCALLLEAESFSDVNTMAGRGDMRAAMRCKAYPHRREVPRGASGTALHFAFYGLKSGTVQRRECMEILQLMLQSKRFTAMNAKNDHGHTALNLADSLGLGSLYALAIRSKNNPSSQLTQKTAKHSSASWRRLMKGTKASFEAHLLTCARNINAT